MLTELQSKRCASRGVVECSVLLVDKFCFHLNYAIISQCVVSAKWTEFMCVATNWNRGNKELMLQHLDCIFGIIVPDLFCFYPCCGGKRNVKIPCY